MEARVWRTSANVSGVSQKIVFWHFQCYQNYQGWKIIEEVPSLSKFWRYLVDVKIFKIRHLIGHISYINPNKKSIFFKKRNAIMLLYMCQIFSSLLGHLQFFVHFFFTFMEYFFIDHPISTHQQMNISAHTFFFTYPLFLISLTAVS